MGMMNLKTLAWDEEALTVAGITPDHLSKLVPTTAIFHHCNPELAAMMGIDPQTPFVIGASDGVLSNLGVNAIKKAKSPSPSGQAVRFARLSMSRRPMKKAESFAMP